MGRDGGRRVAWAGRDGRGEGPGRARVREIGVLLNQAVARLHSTGRPGQSLEPAARIAARRLERLDEAVLTLLDAR